MTTSSALQTAATRRVLVTGACGFLGSHLIRSWARDGASLTAVDDLSRPAASLRRLEVGRRVDTLIEAPVESLPPSVIQEAAPAVVVHLAAQVGLSESWADPDGDFRANAAATWHLLGLLRELAEPPVFVYMSSNKVYGQPPPSSTGVDEHSPLAPDSPYALGKAAGELAVMTAHRAGWVRGAILRCSCLYGPDQRGTESQGWVSHFANRARAGEDVHIHGDGQQIRDALHVDDWRRAVDAAAEQAARSSDCGHWNIGGGPDNVLSPADLWSRLERLLGRPLRAPVHTPARDGDQRWYVSDVRRAERELDWRPTVSIDAGLRTLLE